MTVSYYGHMSGTKIIGVLTVDAGCTVDPTLPTALLTGWLTRPTLTNTFQELHLISGTITIVDPRTLAQAQTDQVAVMKAAREEAIAGTFTWDGSVFDSNDQSQMRITDTYLGVLSGDVTSIDWRLHDNTWRTLDATDIHDVWLAMRTHRADKFTIFSARETSINAASTVSAVVAITWA